MLVGWQCTLLVHRAVLGQPPHSSFHPSQWHAAHSRVRVRAGKDLSTLTMPEKAQFTLVTQVRGWAARHRCTLVTAIAALQTRHACAQQAVVTLVGLSIIRVVTVGPMDEAGEPASPADRLFNYSPAVSRCACHVRHVQTLPLAHLLNTTHGVVPASRALAL